MSPDGINSDEADGVTHPWQSVGYALAQIPEAGGVVIQVEPGVYPPVSTTRRFQQPVLIRSTEPYRAVIQSASGGGAVLLNGASNLVFDGMTVDNRNNPDVSNALHLAGGVSNVTVRRSIITHGTSGYANAHAVKINRDAQDITIDGNLIYNARDELLELSGRVHDITITRNVFYREESTESKPLIALYDYVWRVSIGGNVLIHRRVGDSGYTIQAGRRIDSPQDVREVVVVNNTFLQPVPLQPIWPSEWKDMLFLGNLTNEETVFFMGSSEADTLYRMSEPSIPQYNLPDRPMPLDDLAALADSVRKQDLRLSDYFSLSGIPDSLRGLIIELSERLYRLDRIVNP